MKKIFNPELKYNQENNINDWVFKTFYENINAWQYFNDNYELHRLNAPAIENNETKIFYYYINGKCHRLDGYQSHNKNYCINDKEYSEEEYWKHTKVIEYCNKKRDLNKLIFL